MVGESGFEPSTPWSRIWVVGTNFVATQSFEWCFNRLILAQLRQFWRNVNPQIATLARGSMLPVIEGEERVTPTNKILAQQEDGFRKGRLFRYRREPLPT
jgi:hypothetical protein